MRSTRALFTLLAAALLAAAIPAALALQGAPTIDVIYPDPQPPERITPITIGGTRYISTNDIARVFRATKYWRPELRKLSLRLGDHTIRFTVDAPIVLVDEEARNLVESPRLVQGVVYVPESVLGGLMEWGFVTNATWDEPTRSVRFRSPAHTVRQAQLWVRGRVTEISATLLKALSPRLIYATPGELRLLFEDGTLDSARVFSGGVVLSGMIHETADGVEIRLVLAPGAQGYSVSVSSNRLKLAVTDDQELVQQGIFSKLEPVALGGADGKIRTIVIDPGHGGKDLGATLPGGAAEKDAALDLARALRTELQERLGARVILTRDGDSSVPVSRRSEIADESGAELFVSIHFDAEGVIRNGGFRVYALSSSPAPGSSDRLPLSLGGEGGVEMHPWDSAQSQSTGTSMAVGQAIADGLARTFPQLNVVFRTGRFIVLEPVAAPAVVLECAPAPRGGPEAMSLQGYTIRDVAKTVAQTIQDLARAGRA
ncbi:MAG TPA: N-acetylmuramoyl-L-alanine amidase [Candidatus Limnocylindrales bacterium]|nr:N-acetylmuramoyl-L-alanine amidase [Candidatus Limnocylindrales bacterium]